MADETPYYERYKAAPPPDYMRYFLTPGGDSSGGFLPYRPLSAQKSEADLLERARQEYPVLQNHDVAFKQSPATDNRMLEFYPVGERDSFDPSRAAVEVFGSRAKPSDVAGDIVSHHLAQGGDKRLTEIYSNFERSLTPEQHSRLREQYDYAKANEGENRPYADWYKTSGLPAYFRGYAFSQWEDPQKLYTPQQIRMFDDMNHYMKRRAP